MYERFGILIKILEMIGIAAFASSGALTAIKHRLDLLGVITVGIITASGGGMLRDVLLGIHPVFALKSPLYITVAAFASVAVFLWLSLIKKQMGYLTRLYNSAMLMCDTLGLGIFTVTGITTAILQGYSDNHFLLVFSGIITGVGGGILRDIIVNRKPEIFVSNIYACASAAGAVVFLLLYTRVSFPVACAASLGTTFLVRICSVKFNWNLPKICIPMDTTKEEPH